MTTFPRSHWGYKGLFYTRMVWIVLHLFLLGFEYKVHDWNWYVLLLSCLIVGAVPQLVWLKAARPWVYPVTELLMSGVFLIYCSYLIDDYFSYLAIPAMCAAANIHTARLRIPLWIWFSVIPAIAMTVVLPLSSFHIGIIEGFFFFTLGCGMRKMMDIEWKMQQLLNENERQRKVLEQHTKQVEMITLLEERNRLSRELHDTVGHTLTSIIMGLDAVSYLITEAPDEAIQNINHLRMVSRNGLEEVRKQIHHIAPSREVESLSVQLKRLAGEFAVNTATNIEFEAMGPEVSVPLPITMTLVRCLQESLTNAKRHGRAEHIHISFAVETDRLTLAIHDNGCGMDKVKYGFGLSVMQERIEAYQGELQVKSNKNSGTIVLCHLPLNTRKVG
ncbi:sensor histidine kinase [Cohnella yongneupensis]|uniref:histidine kinase n=1 Tax=Cohnella yongneupensis TaxID=425006 RepID=A0ABW0QWZ4_9BACL